MKITKVTPIGKRKVYDISVDEAEHYVLENGVLTHNTGVMYSANTIFIIGKSQNKKGTEIEGYNFTINIEKSRFVKEKSKFPITVSWEGGILKWAGFLDDAMEGGYVDKPSNGYYTRPIVPDDKKWREKQTQTDEWWEPILTGTDFKDYLTKKYKISHELEANTEDEVQ